MAQRTATTPDQRQLAAWADPRCSVILVSIIAATPLAILPGSFATRDTTPKLAILYLSSALLLWFAARSWSGVAGLWRASVGRSFYSLLILGTVSVLISSACSGDPWLSFAGTVWRRLGAMSEATMFFIAAVIAAQIYVDRRAARKLMLGMEGADVIASVYAILQYAGWDPLIPAYLYTVGSAVRPPATLGHATYFATFLLPGILTAAWFRLREPAFYRRRMHEIVFFLSITALILSGTRSAVLGLGAGICALIYLHKERFSQRRTLVRAAGWALALGVVIASFLLLPSGAGVRVRLAQWVGDWAGGPRLMVWRDSLPLFRQHAVLGIGSEMFEAEFRRAESLDLARTYPDYYHESPHNFFLEIGLSQGTFGLAVWAGLMGLGCWCGFASGRRRDSESGALLPGLLAMSTSLQFCPLTISNELYLLAIIAMLVGLAEQPMQAEFRRMQLPRWVVRSAAAAGVAILVIGASYVVQDILYALTENRIGQGDVAGAERWYGLARKIPMPGPNLEVSRQMASLARRSSSPLREEGLAAAKQAAETAELGNAERFEGLYQSAILAILSDNLPRAEAKLRAAIDAAPTWYRPRMILASVLWQLGSDEAAKREGTLALECAGRRGPEVKRTVEAARARAIARASRPPH